MADWSVEVAIASIEEIGRRQATARFNLESARLAFVAATKELEKVDSERHSAENHLLKLLGGAERAP